MLPLSELTQKLIRDGLAPKPCGPMDDAAKALQDASRALEAAARYAPGTRRNQQLEVVLAHINAAVAHARLAQQRKAA